MPWFYKEVFGFDIQREPRFDIIIYCVCGRTFSYRRNQHEKVEHLADCPHCGETFCFEDKGETYWLCRPKTNAQIHIYKPEFISRRK